MRWDEIAAQYDLIEIRSLIGGRVKIGYPPAVGAVDVNLTGERLLSEKHLIGRVADAEGPGWTFALPASAAREVVELPCARRVAIDDWIVDIGRPGEISQHPATPLRGTAGSAAGGRVFLHNFWCVACYGREGLAWTSRGLFEADMVSVARAGAVLVCKGYIDWVEPGRLFEVHLSVDTGAVIGGDPEAVELYGTE